MVCACDPAIDDPTDKADRCNHKDESDGREFIAIRPVAVTACGLCHYDRADGDKHEFLNRTTIASNLCRLVWNGLSGPGRARNDTIWSHTAFASAYQLPFPLLSEDCPRGNTAHAYGVKGAERGLCVIDTEGTIAWSATFPDAIDPGVDGVLTALER